MSKITVARYKKLSGNNSTPPEKGDFILSKNHQVVEIRDVKQLAKSVFLVYGKNSKTYITYINNKNLITKYGKIAVNDGFLEKGRPTKLYVFSFSDNGIDITSVTTSNVKYINTKIAKGVVKIGTIDGKAFYVIS